MTRWLLAVLSSWQRFWFEPAPPTALGISRVLFYLGLFVFYLPVDFAAWGSVGAAFWMPLPLFDALGVKPMPAPALHVAETVWRVSLLAAAAGVATGASSAVAAALGVYLLGLPHNFGHTFHFDALLAIALVVLACSRAGDAWSVDALMTRRRAAPSAEYTWPIRMMCVMMSLVFFAAGVAKLRNSGLEWIASPNMSFILMRSAYHTSDADPIGGLGLWIAAHPFISRGLGAFTLVVELGFVTALFSRIARLLFVPAAFALLIGIRVTMGPTFGGFLIANVFWIPWDRIGAAVRQVIRRRASASAAVGYDASGEAGAQRPQAVVEARRS